MSIAGTIIFLYPCYKVILIRIDGKLSECICVQFD